MEDFFALYSDFDYNPLASSSKEFYRLCDFHEWDRNDPERKEAHQKFKAALADDFNHQYGTDVNDLTSWRGLCVALDIVPSPDNIAEAKQARINADDRVFPKGSVADFY